MRKNLMIDILKKHVETATKEEKEFKGLVSLENYFQGKKDAYETALRYLREGL